MMKKNKYPDAIHRGTELNGSYHMSYKVIAAPPPKKKTVVAIRDGMKAWKMQERRTSQYADMPMRDCIPLNNF